MIGLGVNVDGFHGLELLRQSAENGYVDAQYYLGYISMWSIMNKILKLNDMDYQTLFGVTKQTFDRMLLLLEKAYAALHKKDGRNLSKLSLPDKLTIMLEYYREYCPMRNIAFDFVFEIQWVEDVLINSGEFSLPSKKKTAGRRRSCCDIDGCNRV